MSNDNDIAQTLCRRYESKWFVRLARKYIEHISIEYNCFNFVEFIKHLMKTIKYDNDVVKFRNKKETKYIIQLGKYLITDQLIGLPQDYIMSLKDMYREDIIPDFDHTSDKILFLIGLKEIDNLYPKIRKSDIVLSIKAILMYIYYTAYKFD